MRVEVLTDRPEDRFAPGTVLYPEGSSAALTIASAQAVEDGPGWRLQFEEIPDRQASEPLRDAYLEIEVDRAADLPEGAAYWHEVIGSVVKDSAGQVLGKVVDVYRAGESEVYVVHGGPSGEFDVPAIRDVITTFAPERRELVVDESVLDLAAPPVDAPVARKARPEGERRRPRWSRHGKGPKPDSSSSGDGASGGPGSDAIEGDAAADVTDGGSP